jgi:hypothetical protein
VVTGIQNAKASSALKVVIPHAVVMRPALSLRMPIRGRPSAVPALRMAMAFPPWVCV